MSDLLVERSQCPSCNQADGEIIYSKPFDQDPIAAYLLRFYNGRINPRELAGSDYSIVRCNGCSLIYQREVPGLDYLRVLYDNPNQDRKRKPFDVLRSYSIQVETLIKFFGTNEITVLDYGMGWGDWLRMARAFGLDAVGTDLSATRSALGSTDISVIDPDDLPSAAFHFINTEQVFEHLVEPRETGLRLAAALRPGGILRISVPSGRNVMQLLRDPDWSAPKGSVNSLNAVAPLEHVNCFSHESLLVLAKHLGVEPFVFPLRQLLDPWARLRPVVTTVRQRGRVVKGTNLYFQKSL